ncbi:MAG: protein kinase, partial [Deltaproteobacteria bacterium]|nr:protein kinase [Deltaproteobacteria bacterium]
VGEVLDGKWRLEGKLGAGGMGAVFLARDVALDRKVAIKVLSAQLCNDAEFVTRFEREARATAQLEHVNIVPVYAVGRHRGRPFIVMKALEGQTLSSLLRARQAEGRRLIRSEILPLFRQLCAGLGFIHSKGCIHRDVKPGNVFVGTDGHVTLLDFGVLKDPNAARITGNGVLLGTPTYIAPEQALGAPDLDCRADLYALGILLFESIALRPPFSGDPIVVMRQQVEQPPPDIRALSPALPAAVAAVVDQALAKKRSDRFQTAEELGAALAAAWPEAPGIKVGGPELVATLPAAFALVQESPERGALRVPAASAPPGHSPQVPSAAAATLGEHEQVGGDLVPTDPARPMPKLVEASLGADSDDGRRARSPAPAESAFARTGSQTVSERGPKHSDDTEPLLRPSQDPGEEVSVRSFALRVKPRWPAFVAGVALIGLAVMVAWLALRS